ncbi:MAG: PQQ-binding-like beta-propeller repeat protein [Patescibacteria group bacterium]|nr:PQQ-binding-like beta-propeller repeat protein [Patescibacteria group bacterium]
MKKLFIIFLALAFTVGLGLILRLPLLFSAGIPGKVQAQTRSNEWSMAGANPQRTSHVDSTVENQTEIKGQLNPEWYKKIDPYIPGKVQVIAASDILYVSTSRGLYAYDVNSTNLKWIYCTSTQTASTNPCSENELPLGHSPTYYNGTIYVGGYDKKIHAIDGSTGAFKWAFTAGDGFDVNPLVVNNVVYAGNRDGYFYAIDVNTGNQIWRYQTGGPIRYSAAYKNNVVYFASNDMFAYALNATDGSVIWKSSKIPGLGFYTYWPVIYTNPATNKDYVIFTGAWPYRAEGSYGGGLPAPAGFESYNFNGFEGDEVFPDRFTVPYGTIGYQTGQVSGPWATGSATLDLSKPNGSVKSVPDYFENKPWRRTVFVLDAGSGQEFTTDLNNNGKPEYAPFLQFGTYGSSRYPAVIGGDKVPYLTNDYQERGYINAGNLVGWNLGSPVVQVPSSAMFAVDEPVAYSGAGNMIYWKHCCFRQAGSFDLSKPNTTFPQADMFNREWQYFGYDFTNRLPEYQNEGWRFAYGTHGDDQSPPVPYKGKVYMFIYNSLFAFSPTGSLTFPQPTPRPTTTPFTLATKFSGLTAIISSTTNLWPSLVMQSKYAMTDQTIQGLDPTYYELAKITASDTLSPTTLVSDTSKAIATKVTQTFGANTLTSWVSKRAPATLFQTDSNLYNILGNYTKIAYPTATGTAIFSGSGNFTGTDMSGSWILAWNDTNAPRFMPILISLQHRPTQITYSSTGIRMNFSGQAGYLSVTPFNGLANPALSQAQAWGSSLPADIVQKAQTLNQISKSFPVDVTESFNEDQTTHDVIQSFNYTYTDITDDWNTQTQRVAFLPPDLGLAAWGNSPIRINGQPASALFDLNYPTPWGRLMGVSNSSSASVALPGILKYWNQTETTPNIPDTDPLKQKLISEVDKILAAGHLKPGYFASGLIYENADDRYPDYFSNPAETIYTLIRVLPLLPADKQAQVRTYIQNEYTSYPPYNIIHVGWRDGANRNSLDLPPETITAMSSYGPKDYNSASSMWAKNWNFLPYNFFALSQYADTFGGTATVYNLSKPRYSTLQYSIGQRDIPYLLNSYLAGDMGYLKLASTAGETSTNLDTIKQELVKQLIKRAALSKNAQSLQNSGFEYGGYPYTIERFSETDNEIDFKKVQIAGTYRDWDNIPDGQFWPRMSLDFVNLVPPVAAFMKDYVRDEVKASVDSYNFRAPYWFASLSEGFALEGTISPLYNVISNFQAKAMILEGSRESLEKYLDVPAFERGDLFYIQNLTSVLTAKATTIPADVNQDLTVDANDLKLLFENWNIPRDKRTDVNGDEVVNSVDFALILNSWGRVK